ncbi:cyclic nucleotide-binding domain-containing protein [Rhizobium alvei]|uniref:Cyclic nucleotide-binding domain-containing protein n=1 Tax=Rhizobium alvei TaxID=1132659 RepID=A0ABT8YP14_9HYPH|nr:cyclic nucleotide-binding domain-containing protein [Rhizobium alvei]MDO6965017.1 cyclic nucleotide-binding domain-containing protein [Rhizobium alvei]
MALKDDIVLLAKLPIFDGVSEEHLRLLAFGAERRKLEKGHVLFREGAAADSAFIVLSGHLRLSRHTTQGEKPIDEAGPGTILSEIAMISEADRHFTATASVESEVMRITRTLFRRMLEEYPDIAAAMQRRLRENFTRLTAALDSVSGAFR